MSLLWWLLLVPADAHDLWFVSEDCTVPAGVSPRFELQLGSAGRPEEARGMEPARAARFELLVGDRSVALPPTIDRIPLPPDNDGLVVLDRTPAHADLSADTFAHYLEEEHHTAVLAAREATGQASTPGREDYTRHLKLLVGASGESWARNAGQDYEIVLLDDPRTLHAGDRLRARVWLHGAPIGGVRVRAVGGLPRFGSLVSEGVVSAVEGTTNARGKVSLALPADGPVLLRSVHMEACTDCSAADWRSWWAAFTFCVGSAPR